MENTDIVAVYTSLFYSYDEYNKTLNNNPKAAIGVENLIKYEVNSKYNPTFSPKYKQIFSIGQFHGCK